MRTLSFICFYFLLSAAAIAQVKQVDTGKIRIDYTYKCRAFAEDTTYVEEDVMLILGTEYSLYGNSKSYEIQKVLKQGATNNKNIQMGSMVSLIKNMPSSQTHNFKIIKNFTTHELYLTQSAFPMYTYSEEEIDFQWEVLGEQQEISGYQCIKAKGYYKGRDYVAWFTPELPISEGPYKFYGLPGVILSIHDTGLQHIFEAKSISKTDEAIFHTKNEILSFEKFSKRHIKFFEKCQALYQNGKQVVYRDHVQELPGKSPENIRENLLLSSLSNPIEIYHIDK
ncbi:GLPGLI family protein [Limibacter armeniacum]|uniref:GLPGLI family protein n=1 Tax=Limibacter armeniacum TaxID=466084 RepID=UPI002FE5A178